MLRLIIKIILIIIIVVAIISIIKALQPVSRSSTPELTKARIQPVGQVNVAVKQNVVTSTPATAANQSGDVGKKIYESKCVICHGSGLAGAPKFGDSAAWQPRLAKGMSILFTHVKNGYNAMPPKGTCMECSDSDLQAAIAYMTKNGK
jgi:cytochrome c5